MRTLAWALLLVGAVGGASGVDGQVLSGRVVDGEGRPLGDVEVRLFPERVDPDAPIGRRWSDAEGRFSFAASDGVFRLWADRLGYAPFRSGPLALRAADSLEFRLTLRVDAVAMEGLEITASRRPWWEILEPPGLWGFYDRMSRHSREGRGRFFTRADVAPWGGVPVARALSALVPAIRAVQDPARPGQYRLRGPGGCLPVVFVDGVHVPLQIIGANGAVVDEIPLDMVVGRFSLAAVETYRGMSQAPVELTASRSHTDLRCTVVGLWTRRR